MKLLSRSESCKEVRVTAHSAWPCSAASLTLNQVISPVGLDLAVFPEPPLSRSLRPRDNPLLEFRPSSGFYPHSPPTASPRSAPPMGFLPLQRMRRRESAFPEAASLGTFRSQGFAPSHRFSPLVAARVCFAPVALLGFSPSGVFPLKKPCHLHRCAQIPSWRFFRTAAGSHGVVTDRRRLQPAELAFAVRPSFAFKVFSSPRVRACRCPLLRTTDRRSPLGLSPSYGFPLVHG